MGKKTSMNGMLVRGLGFCVCISSIAAIYILQLTELRPLGFAEKAEEINAIIVNLSYSYLAAVIFYMIMNYLPRMHRKKIMRRKIDSYLSRMKSAILQCIKDIELYSFERNKPLLSRSDFIRRFSEKDLTLPCDYIATLEKKSLEINLLIESLLTIQDSLTDEEVNKLLMIKDSLFLTQPIRPKDCIEKENGERIETPGSNQEEMAKDIYDIYEQINNLV